jgi:hypothetical protein
MENQDPAYDIVSIDARATDYELSQYTVGQEIKIELTPQPKQNYSRLSTVNQNDDLEAHHSAPEPDLAPRRTVLPQKEGKASDCFMTFLARNTRFKGYFDLFLIIIVSFLGLFVGRLILTVGLNAVGISTDYASILVSRRSSFFFWFGLGIYYYFLLPKT